MEETKFSPWPQDGIVFLKGDWVIERGSAEGLYTYSVGGLKTHGQVDGVQLVRWHMAEPIAYAALTPWKGADIEFTDKADILRDLSDTSKPVSARSYFVEISTNKGVSIQRVNRCYLVQNGYARASAAFKEYVLSLPVKGAQGNVWPQDNICLVPCMGYTVEKGTSSGQYRVTRWGTKYNWNAARLLEIGLAVPLYEKNLAENAKATGVKITKMRERFHDFWMAPNAGEISSLRQIAALWHELENEPDSPMRAAIYAHNQRIYEAHVAAKLSRLIHEGNLSTLEGKLSSLENLKKEIKKLDAKYNSQAGTVWIDLLSEDYAPQPGRPARANPFDTAIERTRGELIKKLSQASSELCDASSLLQEIEKGMSGVGAAETATPFPVDELPTPANKSMRAAHNEQLELYASIQSTFKDFASKGKGIDFNALRGRLAGVSSAVKECEEREKGYTQTVQKARARRKQLDNLIPGFGAAYRSRPPLLGPKPWPEDRIRFTTGVKIKRAYGSGLYTVGVNLLNTRELLYLGLAKRK